MEVGASGAKLALTKFDKIDTHPWVPGCASSSITVLIHTSVLCVEMLARYRKLAVTILVEFANNLCLT
jgi:hypothetical protein